MPGAAIVGSTLNTHATRSKALWVGGVDVIADPIAPVDYWVPVDTVHIQEAGPGNVSSMDFVIECSSVQPVVVADGMDVRFWDFGVNRNYPLFLGFVDHVDITNMPGDVATRYEVQCTGIEAVLDWSLMAADITFPAGSDPQAAVLGCVGNAVGNALGWLSAIGSIQYSLQGSGVENAIGLGDGITPSVLNAAVTVTAGTTLREAIRQVGGQVTAFTLGTPGAAMFATVDFWGGLRWWSSLNGVSDGSDAGFGILSVDDDPPLAGSTAENLAYGIDASQTRGVIVKGTGVTVYVSDGSGKPGSVALLADTTITTTAAAQSAGVAYLAPYAAVARGSFEQQDWDPTNAGAGTLLHPGGRVVFRDARVGLSAISFQVTGIDKTFNPSQREDWLISFGGDPPSVTSLTRQLTRGTLS